MIGGSDIVFPTVGGPPHSKPAPGSSRHWPDVRFEDAVTGEKYHPLEEIPFGQVRELLAYPNADAEAAWDSDRPDSPENSMLSFIARPEDVTVVVDNPHTPAMQSILRVIHNLLRRENTSKIDTNNLIERIMGS